MVIISSFFLSCRPIAPEKYGITTILEIRYAISSYYNSETDLYQTYSGTLGTLLTNVFAFSSHVDPISPYVQTLTHTHTHRATNTQQFNSRVNYSCGLSVQSREKCSEVHLQPQEGNFPCQLTPFLPSAKGQESFSFGR